MQALRLNRLQRCGKSDGGRRIEEQRERREVSKMKPAAAKKKKGSPLQHWDVGSLGCVEQQPNDQRVKGREK